MTSVAQQLLRRKPAPIEGVEDSHLKRSIGLFAAIPAVGKVVTGDGAPSRYLVESIRKFPDRDTFEAMIAEAGFAHTGHRALTGGIVAFHWGWRI